LSDVTGVVTDTYSYDAWGILVASTGSTPNSRLYVGEEVDPDLGLINLRARQYKSGRGRFWTLDPIEGTTRTPVTFNRYLYASGDPATLLDPNGMATSAEYSVSLLIATQGLIPIFFKGRYANAIGVCGSMGGFLGLAVQSIIPEGWIVGAVWDATCLVSYFITRALF
jgi:RHS repeat-associated protein